MSVKYFLCLAPAAILFSGAKRLVQFCQKGFFKEYSLNIIIIWVSFTGGDAV